MKTSKLTKAEKLASDISFVKDVARDMGRGEITDAQAKKALKITKGDYYDMKDYFIN